MKPHVIANTIKPLHCTAAFPLAAKMCITHLAEDDQIGEPKIIGSRWHPETRSNIGQPKCNAI